MHVRNSVLLLLWCFAFCSRASFAEAEDLSPTSAPEPVSTNKCVTLREAPRKPLQKWQVEDVSDWMTYTVGYPEYVGFVRKHLIDGPTLLAMEPADFEEYFPIEHALHAVKLEAHLRILKGVCLCEQTEDKAVDFWSHMRQEKFRVWFTGSLSLFFPRLAMLYTYLFDNGLYEMLLSVPVPQTETLTADLNGSPPTVYVPFFRKVLYLLSMVAAPDLFMVVQTARVVTTNYIIMPCFLLRFVQNAIMEYMMFYLIYIGDAFTPGISLPQKIWDLYNYTLFVPIVALLLYPIIPYEVQTIVVVGLVLHSIFCIAGGLVVGYQFFTSAEENDNKKTE